MRLRLSRMLLTVVMAGAAWSRVVMSGAQEETVEENVPPPDVAEVLGTWWARLEDPQFLSHLVSALLSILTVAIITTIIYLIVMILFRRAVIRVERQTEEAVQPDRRRKQRIVTVLELLRSVAKWVILITGGVWILASAGMDIRPVLAGAGVLGLAVGFGAQNLVRDIVSGFFMLLEGQYAVGDYIQVGANFGMVESIGMRVTVLKDLDNQRHFIPNGTIASVTVYEEPFVNYVVEVPLADAADSGRAVETLATLAEALEKEYERYLVYHKQPQPVTVDDIAVVRLPVAVFPTQDWLANDEIPASIKEAFAEAQIPIREGRNIRVYMDLSRMPEYRYSEEADDSTIY